MRNPYRYFNSSPEVIRLVVLMYIRYPLSLRQVEDLLHERGIDICHETVRLKDRAFLFRIIESVGRWSMIDIFMISILIALVKLGSIATIEPGIGATSFAGVVIITMIASMMFDPRLMWDAAEQNSDGSGRIQA